MNNIINNIINNYKKTGKIGKTRPYNLDHAKRIAWCIAYKEMNKPKIIENVMEKQIEIVQLKLF